MINCFLLFSFCSVESSEIDLSEFEDPNLNDDTGTGDRNDNNRDADGQVGGSTAQEAAGTDGAVSLTRFTLKLFI